MLKRFLSYYKPQMGLFVADTVCALVLAAIDLAFPIILRNLTGGLFTQGQAAIMQALGMIAVGLVLMYVIRCACRYFVSYWGHVMGARMESKMREDLFDQYERFSFAYFDRNSSGDMMSRVVNDLFDILRGGASRTRVDHHLRYRDYRLVCDPLYHRPGAGARHGRGDGGVCGHHVLAEHAHARGL